MTASFTVDQHVPTSREQLAPPVACTVSESDAARQLQHAKLLAPHLLATSRTPVELRLTFAAGADRAALAAFAETERECCSFFEQITDATQPDGRMTLHYTGAADGSHDLALAEVARIFDAAESAGGDTAPTAPDGRRGGGSRRKTAGVLAAAGLACSACLIPGLAVGGAGIFAGTAISGERLLLAAGAAPGVPRPRRVGAAAERRPGTRGWLGIFTRVCVTIASAASAWASSSASQREHNASRGWRRRTPARGQPVRRTPVAA